MRGSYGCLDGRFRSSHAHGRRLVILGTTDDSVSTKLAVNPKRAQQFENDDHEGCRNNQKDVWHGPFPLSAWRLSGVAVLPGRIQKHASSRDTSPMLRMYLFWRTG